MAAHLAELRTRDWNAEVRDSTLTKEMDVYSRHLVRVMSTMDKIVLQVPCKTVISGGYLVKVIDSPLSKDQKCETNLSPDYLSGRLPDYGQ